MAAHQVDEPVDDVDDRRLKQRLANAPRGAALAGPTFGDPIKWLLIRGATTASLAGVSLGDCRAGECPIQLREGEGRKAGRIPGMLEVRLEVRDQPGEC